MSDGLLVRVRVYFHENHLDKLDALGIKPNEGNDHLRVGGIKVFHGNSLSGRTCWLYEPYAVPNEKTGEFDYYGIPPEKSQDEIDALVARIHEAGFQAAIHSNGDREIDMLLDAYEKALAADPRDNHRHRIEHASVSNQSILRRVKELGIVLALHSYIYEHGDKMDAYGETRWPKMHANRTALDMGIVVAGNSDYPISNYNPLIRIQSLVTRRHRSGKTYGPEQRITVEEALWTYTMGSAIAGFNETSAGSITPGKLADFVVLNQDPTVVNPSTLKDLKVDATYIDGNNVYTRD